MEDIPALAGDYPVRTDRLIFESPTIEQAEIDEVVDYLRSGWIGTGPKVKCFENTFKKYIGAKHAEADNSCTASLHLALLAIEIEPGDEVITPVMTFTASAAAIIHSGCKPVFVDVDLKTMNIDIQLTIRLFYIWSIGNNIPDMNAMALFFTLISGLQTLFWECGLIWSTAKSLDR